MPAQILSDQVLKQIPPDQLAEECVEQARYFGVNPHYLIAVGQLRSQMKDGAFGDRYGPFRYTADEWNAYSQGDELASPFTPGQMTVWPQQCRFAAFSARRCGNAVMDGGVGGFPTDIALYASQFPDDKTVTPEALTAALQAVAKLLGPAIQDSDPGSDAAAVTLPDAQQPAVPRPPDAVLPSTPAPNPNEELFVTKAPGIIEKLMGALGLADFQAAGILGNIGYECGGFLVMQEISPKSGPGGFGWCQWTKDRRTKFMAFCQDEGLLPSGDAANYAYLLTELQGTYKPTIDALRGTLTLSSAVRVFEKGFENAGVKRYDRRDRWATLALAAWTKRLPPPVVKLLDPDASYNVLKKVVAGSVSYWLIDEHADGGGQVLIAQDGDKPPLLLARETILLPIPAELVPDKVPAAVAAEFASLLGPDPQPDPVQPPAPIDSTSGVAAAVLATAKQCDDTLVTRSVPNTDHGHLACAWAVNEVVRRATGKPIGGGRSTAALGDVLASKHTKLADGGVFAGCIVISPTRGGNVGHVGILGELHNPISASLIYSNSSSRGVFSHSFTLGRWKNYYTARKGLQTLFFAVKP